MCEIKTASKVSIEAIQKAISIVNNFSDSTIEIVEAYGGISAAMENFFIPRLKDIFGLSNTGALVQLETYLKLIRGEDIRDIDTPSRQIDLMYLLSSAYPFPKLHVGDNCFIKVKVPDIYIDGIKFEALDIPKTEVIVSHVFDDGKIAFQFEDVLFFSAINPTATNEGGFQASTLSKYLNNHFLPYVFSGVIEKLNQNIHGQRVTPPTVYEVYGDDEEGCDVKAVNWSDEPMQHDFFKKIKNRIRTYDNDTKWWWLSVPYRASNTTSFAYVYSHGYANYGTANTTGGGVAPCFCVRSTQ